MSYYNGKEVEGRTHYTLTKNGNILVVVNKESIIDSLKKRKWIHILGKHKSHAVGNF
jgi:hypothetical protein